MNALRASLIIGFPGELARRTAADLADRGRPVRILAPPAHEAEAEAFASGLPEGARAVSGDLEHIDLGLPGREYLDLAGELESIVVAALPAPAGPEENVPSGRDAVREVLELAVAARDLAHVVILSHVDVAGDFPGRFAERDLELGQHLEAPSAKERFAAERICRRLALRLPITVVRGGWVVGSGQGLAPLFGLVAAAGDEISRFAERRLALSDIDGLSRLLGALVSCPPPPGGRVLHAVDPGFPAAGDMASRLRAAARDLAPASFDLAAGARRLLQREAADGRWTVRDFFGRQPPARIETAWSERFLADRGLPSAALDPGGLDELIERAIEEIVGLR